MSTTVENEYVLGTHDAELERLGLQHALWREQAHALWERAGFGPGQTLLDVGCGPGYATFDLARLIGPSGRVLAIDESQRFLSHLHARQRALGVANIDARPGDVQRLDLPPGGLDGAYARWVLCWVSDPAAVVAGVAKALRPGGVFAVQDYFNYRSITLAPRGPALDRVVQAVVESYARTGGDGDIVGRLPAMMAACGLEFREIRPILRVARPGSALWEWPGTFFHIFTPKLVAAGLLTTADQRAFEEEWAQRSRDPHTFFFTPPVFDVIAVKR